VGRRGPGAGVQRRTRSCRGCSRTAGVVAALDGRRPGASACHGRAARQGRLRRGPPVTSGGMYARTRTAVTLGRAAATLSRRLGRGNGSVIGGRVLMAIDPHALERLAAGHRTVLVSGTNGKTPTTRMPAAAIGAGGPVVTNVRGANMPPGLAAALGDGEAGAPAVLEVDEAWMPAAARAVRPEVIVLLNLSRDQLDRNTEVRTLSRSWREV